MQVCKQDKNPHSLGTMASDKRKVDESLETEKSQPKAKKTRIDRRLEEIPTTAHYHVSFMHRATVSHVVSSARHGYVVTACEDGIVKFWKRTPAIPPEESVPKASGETSVPCLEFCKSYTAHIGQVFALCLDPEEDTVASIGRDGLIKLYDVSTFDATAMVKSDLSLGRSACFLRDAAKDLLLAISDFSNGNIYVYSIATLKLVQTLLFHSKPVTALAYNTKHKCCISADQQGIIELWDCTSGSKDGQIVGAPCTVTRNQLEFDKIKTDLYSLTKKKTYAVSLYMSTNYFVVYGTLFQYILDVHFKTNISLKS